MSVSMLTRRFLVGTLVPGGFFAGSFGMSASAADEAAAPNGAAFANLGLCVTHLDRSVAFYRNALGFSAGDKHDFEGEMFARQLSLGKAAKLTGQMVTLGTLRIELIQYHVPQYTGAAVKASTNQPGLTHLSFRFRDLNKVVEAIPKFGGQVFPETKIRFGKLDVLFGADPDNVRLELGSVT